MYNFAFGLATGIVVGAAGTFIASIIGFIVLEESTLLHEALDNHKKA